MSTKSLTLGAFGGWSKTKQNQPNPRPLSRSSVVLPRRSQSRSLRSYSLNRDYLTLALIIGIAGLLVAYVFGINQSAAKGYEITKQKNKLNALTEENKKLLVRTAEVGSILQIQDQALASNLVPITNQEYLQFNQLTQR